MFVPGAFRKLSLAGSPGLQPLVCPPGAERGGFLLYRGLSFRKNFRSPSLARARPGQEASRLALHHYGEGQMAGIVPFTGGHRDENPPAVPAGSVCS